MTKETKRILIACPHGFCSGVARAMEIAEAALKVYPSPVYCLNEIVHNQQVVEDLATRGMVFVKSPADVPEGATLLFSAHGVSPAVHHTANARELRVVDATCPFVSKVHNEVLRYAAEKFAIFLIGYRQHEEVIGVAGEAPNHVVVIEDAEEARQAHPPDPDRVAVVTQTTLTLESTRQIMDVLRSRFPKIQVPAKSDICYATQNRQSAVRALADKADLILVLGSENSSNSRRLVEVGNTAGCRTFLLRTREELSTMPLTEAETLGITSGASVPESYLNDIIEDLRNQGFGEPEKIVTVEENTPRFRLPADLEKELQKAKQ